MAHAFSCLRFFQRVKNTNPAKEAATTNITAQTPATIPVGKDWSPASGVAVAVADAVPVAERLVEDPPVVKTMDVEGAMVETEEDVSVEVGLIEVGGREDEDGFVDDVDGGRVVAGTDVVDEEEVS